MVKINDKFLWNYGKFPGIMPPQPRYFMFPSNVYFPQQCSGQKQILKDWEANAMVASFVSPIRADLNLIRSTNLTRIDARAVHFAAIFMKGVVNFYLLNAACDFPVARCNAVPWAFWDGKVFHHFYLRAKLGARIDDLVNHKEELLRDFQEIKSLIAAHVPAVPPPTRTPAPTSSQDSTPKGSPKKSKSHRSTPSSSPAHSPPIQPPQPPTTLNITKPTYMASSGSPRISPRGSPLTPHSPHIKKVSATAKRSTSPSMGSLVTKSPIKKAANGPKQSEM
ncbi:hypothetical protein FHG87_006102 [Trinorchestia longiramus]|nr:hypothetical protein FHG87_006102 [Trinorchestia longiramus]